jgi:catechol 2,3-dioxygenase-like lactoylglutathione lyase family enzyme
LEVVTLPVADVDRSLAFYTDGLGFTLDVDYQPEPGFGVEWLSRRSDKTARNHVSQRDRWPPGCGYRCSRGSAASPMTTRISSFATVFRPWAVTEVP